MSNNKLSLKKLHRFWAGFSITLNGCLCSIYLHLASFKDVKVMLVSKVGVRHAVVFCSQAILLSSIQNNPFGRTFFRILYDLPNYIYIVVFEGVDGSRLMVIIHCLKSLKGFSW